MDFTNPDLWISLLTLTLLEIVLGVTGLRIQANLIATEDSPPVANLRHAGAIIGGADDTAEAKKRILAECGIAVSDSPADMAVTLLKRMGKL